MTRRPDAARFAALAAVLPAVMIGAEHAVAGGFLGLSEDFWKGGVIGVCIALQLVLLTLALRGRACP